MLVYAGQGAAVRRLQSAREGRLPCRTSQELLRVPQYAKQGFVIVSPTQNNKTKRLLDYRHFKRQKSNSIVIDVRHDSYVSS